MHFICDVLHGVSQTGLQMQKQVMGRGLLAISLLASFLTTPAQFGHEVTESFVECRDALSADEEILLSGSEHDAVSSRSVRQCAFFHSRFEGAYGETVKPVIQAQRSYVELMEFDSTTWFRTGYQVRPCLSFP